MVRSRGDVVHPADFEAGWAGVWALCLLGGRWWVRAWRSVSAFGRVRFPRYGSPVALWKLRFSFCCLLDHMTGVVVAITASVSGMSSDGMRR